MYGDICPPGFFCPAGTASPYENPCPPGTYNPSPGGTDSNACLLCTGGQSCSQYNLTEVDGGCNPGHYCFLGAEYSNPIGETWGDLCQVGQICPENSSVPSICPNGTYIDVIGGTECILCPAGSYCIEGSTILPCPIGYYCPEGTGLDWHPCPSGTLNPNLNVSSEVGCLRCPPGRYCQGLAVSQFEGVGSGNCSAGFYCIEGVNTSMPISPYFSGIGGECPPGFYCPEATSAPYPCPRGTFSNLSRLTSESECTPCTPGMYCAIANLTTPSGLCDPGFVCTVSAVLPNPPGNDSTGHPCPVRHFCPQGTSIPYPCNAGTYNPLQAQEECFICPAGYYCLEHSLIFNETICPTGYYCPNGTEHSTQYPCPPGTYSAFAGLHDESGCTPCDPRHYCTGGKAAPDGPCSEGWFCSRGAISPEPLNLGLVDPNMPDSCFCTNISTGGRCEPGSYCPQGSDRPIACPRGMYCVDPELSSPSGECLPGYYCLSGAYVPNPMDDTTGYPCPVGHYCEMGATEPVQCPLGAYLNTTGASNFLDCLPCTAGMYCGSTGLAYPSGPCREGYYCPEGSINPSYEDYLCTPGHYCPEGSETEKLCEGGTYQDESGASECKSCPERYYCPFNASKPLIDYSEYNCPSGYFCPLGTSSATQYGCPRGRYSTLPNRKSESDCLECKGGRYCGIEGLSNPEGSGPCYPGYYCTAGAAVPNPTDSIAGDVCPTGHYCPEETDEPLPCPIGTFMPNTGSQNITNCYLCSPGHFCNLTGLRIPKGPCEPGYYCAGGSTVATPVDGIMGGPCDLGHFCPEGSNQSLPCLPGTYSSQPLASRCDLCPAGHYCLNGLDPIDCEPGFYCEIGTGHDLTPCPPGTFSTQSELSRKDQCTQCSAGFYCSDHGATTVTNVCEAGYFCTLGSNTPTPNGENSTGVAGPCPKGNYCPPNSQVPQPCPKGTFTNQTHLTHESQCTPCLYGLYCESPGLSSPSGPCSPGHYCLRSSSTAAPISSDNTIGGLCPRGHYCPQESSFPIPCDSGTHNPDMGQDHCFPCLASYYCPGASIESELPCPVGHYCLEGTSYPNQYPCPAGYYNDLTQRRDESECKPCPAGYYCEDIGLDSPSGYCDGGWFCTGASPTSQPDDIAYGGICDPGYFCPNGSSFPVPCLVGHYCNVSGLSEVSGQCYAGYYCTGGATVPNPTDFTTGEECPCGHYCTPGSAAPMTCPPGYYSNATRNRNISDCLECNEGSYCNQDGLCEPYGLCSEGYYCPSGQSSLRPQDYICLPGYRCPEGSARPIACEAGFYQDSFGQGNCKTCPEGYYCDGNALNITTCEFGVSKPLPCPQGRYCPLGTEYADQYLCPPGTYNSFMYLTNIFRCMPCPPGQYCDSEGLATASGYCDPGYYCMSNANSSQPTDGNTGDVCPPGFYCPQGTSLPISCFIGTYNPLSGAVGEAFCLDCPGGEYCNQLGQDNTTGLCSAGYYCTSSALSSTPTDGITGDFCPKGHFCPEGTSHPIPCPDGEYSNETHAKMCRVCPARFYCPGSGTIEPLQCPSGYYCPSNTGETPEPCPIGTYNPHTELAMQTECTSCTAGYYCNAPGLSGVVDECEPGYYCPPGSQAAMPSGSICPPGSYCGRGSAAPSDCPPGTFSATIGLESSLQCLPCSPGMYCEGYGMTSPSGECAAGYYCNSSSISARPVNRTSQFGPCPAGHSCPPASPLPTPCLGGWYNPIEMQEECLPCLSGFFCPVGTIHYSLYPCPTGHYCLAHTEHANQYPCPRGTYNPFNESRTVSACLPCPAGEFCDSEGLVTSAGSCEHGYYCSGFAESATPSIFDSIFFTDSSALTCSNVSTGDICPPGTFCPNRSNFPTPCTPGSFCISYGLSEVSGPCSAGYYCNGSTLEPYPIDKPYGDRCPPGSYCEVGTSSPIPCPPGTFSQHSGNHNLSACVPCSPGSYCASYGLPSPTDICPSGVYCPAGQVDHIGWPCPIGHFCIQGSGLPQPCPSGTYQSFTLQDHCTTCPAGYFCDAYEASLAQASGVNQSTHGVVMPISCQPGYYCPEGTNSSSEYPCPLGTFSNQTQLEDISECTLCTPGSYCGRVGLTEPTAVCYAGYVCSLGSKSPDPDGSDSTGYPCPWGYFCPEESSIASPCPPGTFNNKTHLTHSLECTPCTPGMYCPTYNLILPVGYCTGGHYCTLGAVLPTPAGEPYGDVCPVGHYCPHGSGVPFPCPAGSYQPLVGQANSSSCIPCDPGFYCKGVGLSNITGQCSAGYFCTLGASTLQPVDGLTGDICPVGYYCVEQSASPEPCEPGTYANYLGSEECSTCPAGFFCNISVTPIICPPGFYCPEHTGFDLQSCPLGTYNPNSGGVNVTVCLPCNPGMYCLAPGSHMPTGNCSEGYYCTYGVDVPNPSGMNTGQGGICHPSSFCMEGAATPTPCEAGYYTDLPQQSQCTLCPSSYYCPANSSGYANNPCPAGFYCPPGTTHPYEYPCPGGTYNNQTLGGDAGSCLPCPPGTFCGGDGLSEPSGNCSCGWYCSGGAFSSKPIAPTNYSNDCVIEFTGGPCPPGSYCPEGSAFPFQCPMGMYCNDSQLSEPTGSCNAGYWCNGSATTPSPFGSECPPGYYCPSGTPIPTPCPVGRFTSNFGSMSETECLLCTPGYYCSQPGLPTEEGRCTEGYYCPSGTSDPTPDNSTCPVGHYCPLGVDIPIVCPPGSYQDEPVSESCKTCPTGFFCNSFETNTACIESTLGIITPSPCPEGYYCPENTSSMTQYPCPEGTFSDRANLGIETDCIACLPGMYCFSPAQTAPTGICSAGYVCFAGAVVPTPTDGVTGWPCPEGEYCPAGSNAGMYCPPGTFSNQTSLIEESQCQLCPPRYFCFTYGLTEPSGLCYAGHYCTGGAILPNPFNESYGDRCIPGQHCPAGSGFPEPCPPGTYSPFSGNDNVSDCTPCDPGKYCNLPGQLNYTGLCDAGYYCSRGANTSRPRDGTTGDICPEHHYCPEGSSTAIICAAGTYMPNMGAEECLDCPTGLQCINGMAGFCMPGYYCPGGIGHTPVPCPAGSYSNAINITDSSECTPCRAGQYCEESGSTSPTGPCASGYYCSSGMNTSEPAFVFTGIGGVCPIGHYCPEGSGAPIGCDPGSYSSTEGHTTCTLCPPGYYCPVNATDFTPYSCPVGHFCSEGTKFGLDFPCPAGTYNNKTRQFDSLACLQCIPGYYCDSPGQAEPTAPCSPGWYCTGTATSPMPLGLSNTSTEVECYSPDANYTGGRCRPGTFCPEGSPYPRDCTPGMYCGDYELSSPSGPCAVGYYCPGGISVASPPDFICPAGFFCPSMSAFPTPCPIGSFSNQTGLSTATECGLCFPGYYCEGFNLTIPTGECNAGYFCPGNQSTPSPSEFICPRGHFCTSGSDAPHPCLPGFYQSAEGSESCDQCPQGNYCNPSDNTNCTFSYHSTTGAVTPATCPQGYFCPIGTRRSNEYPCPPGTFSNLTGLASEMDCLSCTPGMYCGDPGLTEPSGPCHQGYYCSGGARVQNPEDDITGNVCDIGQYCPEGSLVGIDCPRGTFSNISGIWEKEQCTSCLPGYYCDTTGLSTPTGPCSSGYFCTERALLSNPVGEMYGGVCPAGHYCPERTSVPQGCPPGTYLNQTGAESVDDCTPCEPGMHCNASGLDTPSGPCDAGFYCSRGANVSTPIDGMEGGVCPVGHFCREGSPLPTPCFDGTFANYTQASVCSQCPERHYCTRGVAADACPPGYFCPEGIGSNWQPCPEGTYSAITMLAREEECTQCTPGRYCPYSGLTEAYGDCATGFYCSLGVNTPNPLQGNHTGIGGICPVSHYCPGASSIPLPCPSGTYNNDTGVSECYLCPSGYYCNPNSSTFVNTPCPTGHYCPTGTEYSVKFPCPPGTYNNHTGAQDNFSCVPCLPGMYCEGYGNEEPTGPCIPGWFCRLGANSSKPINGENTQITENCTDSFDDIAGGRCGPGAFCPEGSACPTLCTAGMYCRTYELGEPTGPCFAGYYCEEQSQEPDQFLCPQGHFCPDGTGAPSPCPSGYFSTDFGNSHIGNCEPCTPGYFCSSEGLVYPQGSCMEGYYCPGGQNTSTPAEYACPVGNFCPENTSVPLPVPQAVTKNNPASPSATCVHQVSTVIALNHQEFAILQMVLFLHGNALKDHTVPKGQNTLQNFYVQMEHTVNY